MSLIEDIIQTAALAGACRLKAKECRRAEVTFYLRRADATSAKIAPLNARLLEHLRGAV